MKDQHLKLFQNLNLCHIWKWQTSEFFGMFSSWKFAEVRRNLSENYFFMKEKRNSSLLITSIFAALFSKKCAEILSLLYGNTARTEFQSFNMIFFLNSRNRNRYIRYRTIFLKRLIQGLVFYSILKGQESKI